MSEQLLQVRRGSLAPEELAVLTAILYARAAGSVPAVPGRRATASWRRPERVAGYDGPRTWQGGCHGRN